MQETFASTWKTRAGYHSQGQGCGVVTIVRPRAIEIARRNGCDAANRNNVQPLHAVTVPSDVPAQAAAHAQTRHVLSLLAKLPDAHARSSRWRSTAN